MIVTPVLDVTVDVGACAVQLVLLAYKLELATAFGTAHSSTSFRQNALLILKVDGVFMGVAEAGMPPKKALVYEADLDDCKAYVAAYVESMRTHQADCFSVLSAFGELPGHYFALLRGDSGAIRPVFHALLRAIEQCPMNSASFGRVGRSLVESAVLGACAHDCGLSLQQLIGLPVTQPQEQSSTHFSFYTAALNQDITLIVEAAKFGAQFTSQLKIKLNGDVELSRKILTALDAALPHAEGQHWSIDANCDWSPEVARGMLDEVLGPFKHRIYMIEQPFPVDITTLAEEAEVARQWREVKEAYNAQGMLLFADESMRTAADVALLQPFVNGVNIKLEKCGGLVAAVRAFEEAQCRDMKIWLGCMVGSNVNSTTTAQLYTLACASDLDGALLVTPASQLFDGGFSYTKPSGSIQLYSDDIGHRYGIGVEPKPDFAAQYC
jgi:L-Ala-D/L-Glu epimerase